MEIFENATLREASVGLEQYATLPRLAVVGLVFCLTFLLWRPQASSQPPSLQEAIPLVSNTYLFMTNKEAFIRKAADFVRGRFDIVQFRLGLKKIYLVTGEKNVQALMKSTPGLRAETGVETLLESVWAMPKEEVQHWRLDKTGRGKTPLPGTEGLPDDRRFWYISHQIYDNYLTAKKYADNYALKFYDIFEKHLDSMPVSSEWSTFGVYDWVRHQMAECALMSVMGTHIIDMNPGFLDALWDTDRVTPDLVAGFPRWMKPGPYDIRDKFYAMARKWVETSMAQFDFDGPDQDVDWEPLFGARVTREQAKWMSQNHCGETLGGFFGTFAAGVVANSVPAATWALMELLKDPELYQEVRAEVQTAVVTDPETGKRSMNVPKLLTLPLLQSVYVETMRLHVSYSIFRAVTQPVTIGGYQIEEGAAVLATTCIAHVDDAAWNAQGTHPASQFWGARHIKFVEEVDEKGNKATLPKFAMAARPSSFFPYGGGQSICPGRHVAKQHLLMMLALLLARFEIEMIEWVNGDGSKSDREPEHVSAYVGVLAMPPDRDMKARWRKMW
ncbi:hypothetical protein JX266_012254 [Neoarthrinium moseri]|uniref:uncharacterized protein n=1 Tax=Neoarthrinium moseri TaxID=1658444 RepID=UPI001FDBDC0D|nr:uncharacterized protein JN550_003829 [Neoarthrinium moseri]KAI1841601.1 hypothetical protein JX266_012254 [Neoarthrinium moseri]KAI1872955.1 hypothetical protein JN550_003829 [Neoarthrinium moseri]